MFGVALIVLWGALIFRDGQGLVRLGHPYMRVHNSLLSFQAFLTEVKLTWVIFIGDIQEKYGHEKVKKSHVFSPFWGGLESLTKRGSGILRQ